MIVVGLTGGIGSGKSTVAGMFKDLGVPVYDSDFEAKRLMTTSTELKNAIIELLGDKAYEGEILNRNFIANKIFENPETLQKLNKIVHPAVRADFLEWTSNQEAPYVIQETALIFENDAQDNYDYVILVKAPVDFRLKRVIERDGSSKQEVLGRMKNQMSDDKKEALSNICIDNIDLEITEKRVAELHQRLVRQAD
ncbi:dephospho-CoA kinase [Flagellimonas aquimarina]|uniref:Dephospho-CoA kinase n=1 Tax=Flagellimonas aquimarina TaxID=2201895 RepID=A0A316KWU1_9FLAO|nr:dephospho-CoA kinase [Allomuricauda koreensis]PWL38642.1 dephospho-CoA kinase [Allomuricauda koreensis]